MKKVFLFSISLMLSACVQLTPAGERVQIIRDNALERVAQCKPLGAVSVSSEDALRNASAALSGDTVVPSRRDIGSTSIIHGEIFRCAAASHDATQSDKLKQVTPDKADAEYLRKSTLCQSKGGAWFSNQCIIHIE